MFCLFLVECLMKALFSHLVLLVVAFDAAFLEVEGNAQLYRCHPVIVDERTCGDSLGVNSAIELIAEGLREDEGYLGVPAFCHLEFVALR